MKLSTPGSSPQSRPVGLAVGLLWPCSNRIACRGSSLRWSLPPQRWHPA